MRRGVAVLVPLAALAVLLTFVAPVDRSADGAAQDAARDAAEAADAAGTGSLGDTPVALPPAPGDVPPAVLASLAAEDLPEGCTAPNRAMTLYAVELARVDGAIRLGYGLTRDSASWPGPTIEMVEGDCLAITLVNEIAADTLAELRDDPILGGGGASSGADDGAEHGAADGAEHGADGQLPLGVSIHPHGVKYTTRSDGTVHNDSWVAPGQARTYVWYAEPRIIALDGRVLSHGSAGYWWFHDHVVGTHHGTGGVGSGLFGGLIVRRPGDPLPDHTFALAMGDNATLNLRRYPDTDECGDDAGAGAGAAGASNTCLGAAKGETVEFVVFGIGSDFHTFHLHGHTWVANRTGVLGPADLDSAIVDVVPVGPSYSFGFQVTAGASVGEGDWMLHCHVQTHSDLGMTTFLRVDERFRRPA